MPLLAITVLGHDRPGIIAETTGVLAQLGLNIEDSTMTLLRGHFAMMLVTDGASDAGTVEESLAGLTADGSLSVSVREIPTESVSSRGSAYLLSVHGGDRPGIVSAVVAEVAKVSGNITDLTTRLAGDLYVLIAEVDLPGSADVAGLQRALEGVAGELGVGVTLRPLESDDL
ncbi:glycine cleavage system protein R [Nocardioides marmorisolisilvae]|uniref:ACT domain-containing protein n=1 Tax=Nocardioides marmorisolisilvae TaxID=1542737 RepID=A0A3N0DZE7_9ACTN|nr:ACT domain-containing protein [Nocardioides marmorisolisilvae]RNL80931.1 ACT domain-containing protein [Nocardioides marmorisolisilvae]